MSKYSFIIFYLIKFTLLLSPEERKIFSIDTRDIVWVDYMLMYHFGLHKYILNENVEPPISADMLAN